MKRNNIRSAFIYSMLLLFVFTGCAMDKRLAKSDLKQIATMRIARRSAAPLLVESTSSNIAGITGVLFGAIGGGLGGAIQYKIMESNGKELEQKCRLPDYSKLLFDKFVKRVSTEVEGWPKMTVEQEVLGDVDQSQDEYLLLLSVNQLMLADDAGLCTTTLAKLYGPNKSVLWRKKIDYQTGTQLGIKVDLDKLQGKNGDLLRQEYDFATEATASALINDLNGAR